MPKPSSTFLPHRITRADRWALSVLFPNRVGIEGTVPGSKPLLKSAAMPTTERPSLSHCCKNLAASSWRHIVLTWWSSWRAGNFNGNCISAVGGSISGESGGLLDGLSLSRPLSPRK